MSTIEERVREAKRQMDEADAALRAYDDRPSTEPVDIERHKRLADASRAANDKYTSLVSELRR